MPASAQPASDARGPRAPRRIEGLTKKYGTAQLFSETTRAVVGDSLPANLVDDAEIRGRRETIRLYAAA